MQYHPRGIKVILADAAATVGRVAAVKRDGVWDDAPTTAPRSREGEGGAGDVGITTVYSMAGDGLGGGAPPPTVDFGDEEQQNEASGPSSTPLPATAQQATPVAPPAPQATPQQQPAKPAPPPTKPKPGSWQDLVAKAAAEAEAEGG